MKIPKLKFFYYALNESDYREFERTRIVKPNSKTTLNPATGRVSNTTPLLYFYSRPSTADTRYRQINHFADYPVYVLRIPREYVRRESLESAPDPAGMWIYHGTILLPHCGVERIELDPDQVNPAPVVVASSSKNMITLDTR